MEAEGELIGLRGELRGLGGGLREELLPPGTLGNPSWLNPVGARNVPAAGGSLRRPCPGQGPHCAVLLQGEKWPLGGSHGRRLMLWCRTKLRGIACSGLTL